MGLSAVLAQAAAGWLLADLACGAVHWWGDRVGNIDMPIIGRTMIAPNRVHHHDELAFTRSSLLKRNLATWILTAVVGALLLALFGPSIVLASALVGSAAAMEVQVLAHCPDRGNALTWTLQEMGLMQSHAHHARHHHDRGERYCPLTNLLNPVLDHLGVWALLEAALTSWGLAPNRGLA